jgi:hypothetical protein
MWQNIARAARFIWSRLADLALIHEIVKGWQALVVAVPTLSAFVGGLVQNKPFGEIVFWTMGTFFVSTAVARVFVGGWFSRRREPETVEYATRIKHSSQQLITRSNDPSLDKGVLNLDNLATLVPFARWDHDCVLLMLSKTAVLTVANPQKGVSYAPNSFVIIAPPEVEIANLKIMSGESQQFLFSRGDPVHVVEIGKRKFRVALQAINDNSTPQQKLFHYSFSISEE